MTTQESLTRRYRMLCLRCDRAWETAYEIRTLHDDAGDHPLFYRNGAPAVGPRGDPLPLLRRPPGADPSPSPAHLADVPTTSGSESPLPLGP